MRYENENKFGGLLCNARVKGYYSRLLECRNGLFSSGRSAGSKTASFHLLRSIQHFMRNLICPSGDPSRDGIITAGVWVAGTLAEINCKIATPRRGYNKRRIRSRACISSAVKFVASLKSRAFLSRA